MSKSLILKKVIVKKKLSINEYEVELSKGEIKKMIIPKRLLMNYIKIDIDSEVYIIISSESDKEGKWASKQDYLKNDDLYQQKQVLDEEAKKGSSS